MIKRALATVFAVVLVIASWAQTPADLDKAQALMEQGVALMDQKKADLAEPLLRQAATLSPTNAVAFYYLGSAEMVLNKYASAQEAMQTALRLDAAAPGLVRKQRRESQDILALSYSYQHQYDKARAVYQEAMVQDPMYPGFPYNLACVCALAGDRDAALSALRTALAVDAKADPGPTLPDPAADDDLKGLWGEPAFLATLIASQGPQPNDGPGGGEAREGARRLVAGDPAGAVKLLKSSLQTDPTMTRGWFLLGGALEAEGKGAAAAEAYRKALTLNVGPNASVTKPFIRYAALRSGQAYVAAGEPARAVEALKVGTQADDYYAPLHYELARAFAGVGDRPQAEAELRRAMAMGGQPAALDPILPDPATDPSFARWAQDRDWQIFLQNLR
jgi:tetratricopeptide (TPR) repeat protein